MLLNECTQLFASREDFRFIAAQVKNWFPKSLGEFKSQSRTARDGCFDAKHNGAVAVVDIPFGALRIMNRRRLPQRVSSRNNAVFGSPLPRAPAAVGNPICDGKIECSPIGPRLPARDNRDF